MSGVIRDSVSEILFGFLSDSEVVATSVQKITSPLTYDSLNTPLPGGLYDPALGPTNHSSTCKTCGQGSKSCPGHLGHIELAVPVYHPLLFGALFKLLRGKCASCHKFKLSTERTRRLTLKLALCDVGDVAGARGLDDALQAAAFDEGLSEGDPEFLEHSSRIAEKYLAELEHNLQGKPKADFLQSHDRAYRRELSEGALKAVMEPKKCQNCGAFSPALRKEGHLKIFEKPLNEKLQRTNSAAFLSTSSGSEVLLHRRPKTPAADGDDGVERELEPQDDAEDGEAPEDDAVANVSDKYIAAEIAEARLELLWKAEAPFLCRIFGAALWKSASPQPVLHVDPDGHSLFFLRVLAVAPSRFRPPMTGSTGEVIEHAQNVWLIKIINLSATLKNIDHEDSSTLSKMISTWVELQNEVNGYIDNSKFSGPASKDISLGIRQLLEKKEGLFRKNMMGKRVNYACRSVISPDPYIGTTEIGIPLPFAKTLTYAEPVNPWNFEYLRELVMNGASEYPGANYIENQDGTLYDLSKHTPLKREGFAAKLLSIPGQKVWRHLKEGDFMLVNRQPTLHKPGIMAHSVRVLCNPAFQTIRMHYANCNTYNADFDGDEINCHLPQNELARAEARILAFTDEQYLVPTNGAPLRGLIQDSVVSGVKLCSKNTFLTKGEFQQLVFQALAGLPGLEIAPPDKRIRTPAPTIIRPKELWTGKQLISCILQHLTDGLPQLNMDSKAKTPAVAFGEDWEEHEVLIRQGELLRGVLDKSAFGATPFGLVHCVQELYGPTAAGSLLTSFGRLFVNYLQLSGHTCGVEDLTLTSQAEEKRADLIRASVTKGHRAMQTFLLGPDAVDKESKNDEELEPLDDTEVANIRKDTATLFSGSDFSEKAAAVDGHMMSELSGVASDIIKACLPSGQTKPFPENCFSLMVLTGAKGSMVNHSQISCALGQQALEGRRVPIMVTGKSLPSFEAFDPSPRAHGFISDRFLTGVRPAEYYFHCMAGREGLVDTAVKTSRSGYLQRCLVKHLEDLKVGYDGTVRDGEGSVYQFVYGEDGIDTTQSLFLSGKKPQMDFMARNYRALGHKHSIDSAFIEQLRFDPDAALAAHAEVSHSLSKPQKVAESVVFSVGDAVNARRLRKNRDEWRRENLQKGWFAAKVVKVHTGSSGRIRYNLKYADGTSCRRVPAFMDIPKPSKQEHVAISLSGARVPLLKPITLDPVLGAVSAFQQLGSVSEKFQGALESYQEKEGKEDGLLMNGATGGEGAGTATYTVMMWAKYMRSLAAPGEAVGSVAAQSVGEPSTQMTLNTFHLAGHGGANVTLGIPRLREIVMTASRTLSTPMTVVPLIRSATREQGKSLARRLTRLTLSELLNSEGAVVVTETLVESKSGSWERRYDITLKLYDAKDIKKAFKLGFKELCNVISLRFLPKLLNVVSLELRRCGETAAARKGTAAAKGPGEIENDEGEDPEEEADDQTKKQKKKSAKVAAGDDDESEDEEGSGTMRLGHKKELASYGDMDEEEAVIQSEMSGKGRGVLDEESDGEADDEKENVDESKEEGKEQVAKPAGAEIEEMVEEDEIYTLTDTVRGNPFFTRMTHDRDDSTVTVTLQLPAHVRRLLMVGLAETAAAQSLIRSAGSIGRCFLVERLMAGENRLAIQTEGADFTTLWGLDPDKGGLLLDLPELSTNDIWGMRREYGVEACRASITKEIAGVFAVYGIGVDPRHLGLIADYMTFDGGYSAMNRLSMVGSASPCLQMSFETTATFLVQAALEGKVDKLETPSARIVMGQPGRFGTGCFDLMVPITVV